LKSGNACHHSVQNLLSSSLLSKNLKINLYRTIILPVVLYGFETWLLTLREECRLRVLSIFGCKRDKVRREWRKIHNEELHDLYSSPNSLRAIKSRRMRWVGQVVHMGEKEGTCWIFWGKPQRKRPFGRPRLRLEDNIKMNLQEVRCGVMDWIELAHDGERCRALVNAVMNLQVP